MVIAKNLIWMGRFQMANLVVWFLFCFVLFRFFFHKIDANIVKALHFIFLNIKYKFWCARFVMIKVAPFTFCFSSKKLVSWIQPLCCLILIHHISKGLFQLLSEYSTTTDHLHYYDWPMLSLTRILFSSLMYLHLTATKSMK